MPYACARVVSHDRPPDGATGLQRLVVQVSAAMTHVGGLGAPGDGSSSLRKAIDNELSRISRSQSYVVNMK